MGYSSYSTDNAHSNRVTNAYYTKTVNDIFEQNKLHKIHESMIPLNIGFRECFDSAEHPNTIPIILALDVTGSMGQIPHYLIKDGLPKTMGSLIQRGATDASLLFMAVGDHEVDHAPLQIGQFESGDEELDMWLTRTYIESGGGGNSGESYLLPWLMAARHTKIDSFTKRGKKGFLFTTGDEECLRSLPSSVIKNLIGDPAQKALTDKVLLAEAQKMYNVFHLHILHGDQSRGEFGYWKELLGQNAIGVENYEDVSKIICETVVANMDKTFNPIAPDKKSDGKKEENML